MTLSIIDVNHSANEDLLPLRRMIVRLANRCGLYLADSSTIRRFLDSDFSQCRAPDWDINSCRDLHSMITLLFRLEASTSEDIGINGLQSLGRQHNEILAGSYSGEVVQGGFKKGLVLVGNSGVMAAWFLALHQSDQRQTTWDHQDGVKARERVSSEPERRAQPKAGITCGKAL